MHPWRLVAASATTVAAVLLVASGVGSPSPVARVVESPALGSPALGSPALGSPRAGAGFVARAGAVGAGAVGAGAVGAGTDAGDPAEGRWMWPTGVRQVVRSWEPPAHDYGPGHRGIDVPGAVGVTVVAVEDGEVLFAGPVAGRPVVTIGHEDDLRSSYDSVTPTVAVGDAVRQGDPIGTGAVGHCTADAPCVHLGARVGERYVDPLAFLGDAEWPVLLPGR